MSLENCIEFLRHNVSNKTKKIVLIHLSDANSDEKRMLSEVYNTFNVDTIIAQSNQVIEFKEYPF